MKNYKYFMIIIILILLILTIGYVNAEWVRTVQNIDTSLFCLQGGNCTFNILNVTTNNVVNINSTGNVTAQNFFGNFPYQSNASGWIYNGTTIYSNNSVQKIGIGTNNPTTKLDINGTSTFRGKLNISNSEFELYNSNNKSVFVIETNGQTTINQDLNQSTTTVNLLVYGRIQTITENNNAILFMDSYDDAPTTSGSLIGRRARGNLSTPLAIKSGDWIASLTARGYGNGFLGNTDGAVAIRADGGSDFNATNHATAVILFTKSKDATNGVERMVVNSEGKVGIGTSAPVNKVDIEGALAVGATYSGTNTAPTNGAIIEGNVGIGTTSPTQKLDVNGAVFIRNSFVGNSTGYFRENVYYNVSSWTNTTTNIGSISDLSDCLDENWFNITEQAGSSPGFNNTFTFTGVESFRNILFCAEYDGSTTHDVILQINNYNLSKFITIRQISPSNYINCNYFGLDSGMSRVINSTNVEIRVLHPTTGQAGHDIHINCLKLER